MGKFTDEDNKEAMTKAFELFAMCMSVGPCNHCVFYNRGSDYGYNCYIGHPNSWQLFDTATETGFKNRKTVIDILDRKENKND